MKTINIRILKYLLSINTPQSINSVAKAIKTNYSNVYQNINSMDEVLLKKIGTSNIVNLKKNLTKNLYVAETERKEDLLTSAIFRNIVRKINNVSNPFFILLVFGSVLDKKEFQDIDLCLITNNQDIEVNIRNELNTLSYNIDLNVFSVEEFKEMINLKQNNLGNEIIKKNVILKGIENYYEIIK